MQFEWDENKARSNKAKHGVDFESARQFDFDTAIVTVDEDFDYGEERLKAIGVIHESIYVLVYTEAEDVVRVISLRKANRTEARSYVESC